MSAEPRENDWEELRREIEALPDVNPTPTVDTGTATDWPMVKRASVLAIVDRLAAAREEPPEPGPAIDVERLTPEIVARALSDAGWGPLMPRNADSVIVIARALAAALRDKP